MSVEYKIWDFPLNKIEEQLFHVPGSSFEGGLTSGGARLLSPEPAGRSVLELKPAFQTNEWDTPFCSWLMSKTNGDIFRIPLTKTPQLASVENDLNLDSNNSEIISWDNNASWSNSQNWINDGFGFSSKTNALEGSLIVELDTSEIGEILKHGHVIGFNDCSYLIDDIEYENDTAKITVNPPLRSNLNQDDTITLRPFFLGTIENGSEIKSAYEASKIGNIQLNKIIFNEVIINV